MEKNFKRILTIGILIILISGIVLFLVGFFEKTKIQENSSRISLSDRGDEQKRAEQKAIEDKINQLSDTKEWQLFTSRKCDFSFIYPPIASINSAWMNVLDPRDACELVVYIQDGVVSSEYFHFHIRPLPYPSPYENFNPNKLTENTVKDWNAKKVAEELLNLNKTVFVKKYNRENTLIPIVEIPVNGKKAYTFSLNDGYFNWAGDSHNLENKTSFAYIADNEGKVYEITFPSNDRLSLLILKSLKFSN